MQNGKKIFPEEIEEKLNKIDGVRESLVFDKNNEKDNNKINAIIVYNENKFKQKSQIEIKKFLMNKIKEINESLPNYKRINDIIITNDLLERTSTGKIKRTKSNRRHLLANKTPRAKARGKVQDAYADKTCEAGIKKLLPYGN